VFARAHISLLPINDLVLQVYFHFVSARRNVENLWMITGHRFWSGLYSIDEYERTLGGAGHDDLGRVRRRRFAREPAAGGKPRQCNQYEDSQSLCPRFATKTEG